MKYFETILRFLTSLARIIFTRKQKPADGDCPCPDPFHALTSPSLTPDAGDGSDIDLYRSDSLALTQRDWGGDWGASLTSKQHVEPINLAGYSLMAIGSLGCLYKMLLS